MDLHSSTGFPHPHYTVVSRDNYPRGYCTPLTIPWLDALAHNIFKIIIIRRLYVARLTAAEPDNTLMRGRISSTALSSRR